MQIKATEKLINFFYNLMFFVVPLLFFTKTSELFEFNKLTYVYLTTIIVTSLWVVDSIAQKKLVFKKTLLDYPLIFFLISQLISTVFSSDVRTSVFGYYSRWNGGLLSSVCYSLLYWCFVTYANKKWVTNALKIIFVSGILSSIWAILEHFGYSLSCYLITGNLDVNCWVQDVQLRVFSTFGQPNWLAAFIAFVIPVSVGYSLDKKKKETNIKNIIFDKYLLLSIFIPTLLFTKSKSGLLGLLIPTGVLGLYLVFKKINLKTLILLSSLSAIIFILFGTPFTPTLSDLVAKKNATVIESTQSGTTSLETGGTDSGVIRQIVWKGAINVWLTYPLFGSGVETFASSYYLGRPIEHNNVSEWNYLYNKAHNEYLNYLATTGIVGFTAYIFLVLSIVALILRKAKTSKVKILQYSLLSGFFSILITNFFGFSVVPISILFFLTPALSVAIEIKKETPKEVSINSNKKIFISLALGLSLFLIYELVNYWRADYFYAKSLQERQQGSFSQSLKDITLARSLVSDPLYIDTRASLLGEIVKASSGDTKDSEVVSSLQDEAVNELIEVTTVASSNVKLIKMAANTYDDLGSSDPKYYLSVIDLTYKLKKLAPTDPSVYYQEGLTYAKLDKPEEAIIDVEKAVQLKKDYKIARRLLSYLYKNTGQIDKAKSELKYILENISPDDTSIQKELQSLEKGK